jgi:hypothetical protein
MSPRLILIAASSSLVLAVAVGLYWKGRHDDAVRQRPRVEAALAQAATSSLEARGAQESAQRVEIVVRQRDAAAATVADITPKALNAEDAHAPLDPDRAARLAHADEQLCVAAPTLGGCAPRNAERGH